MSDKIHLRIDRETGRVLIQSSTLQIGARWSPIQKLLSRLLSIPCVASVRLMRSNGTITIDLSPSSKCQSKQSKPNAQALQEIASRLRDESSVVTRVDGAYSSCNDLRFRKTPAGLTTAIIVHLTPGRIRLRHPLIHRNEELARRVESSLKLTPGVRSVSASATTGSVVVLFDKQRQLSSTLPATLERIVGVPLQETNIAVGPSKFRWFASGSCLALALVSTFMAPSLVPLTAAALVGFNLPTMARGAAELLTFRWKIPALYTVIMGTTLISGQFLAAGVMQASITCWHGWSSHRLRRVIARLREHAEMNFAAFGGQGLNGNLETHWNENPEFSSGLERLLKIKSGEIVRCDGTIVEGHGELDERCVRGVNGLVHRQVGDNVFAGSILSEGEVSIRVTAEGRSTRIAKIYQQLLYSVENLPGKGEPTERSQSTGSRFVPFTFFAGTAALAVGDITTLGAVLRPDFTTGPSISERFGIISQIGHLLSGGWLAKDSETLHRLSRTDTVVIIRIKGATTPEAGIVESGFQQENMQLRRRRVMLSSRKVEIHEIESDENFCLKYVKRLKSSHRRLAVVASGEVLKRFASQNCVCVSLTPDDSLDGLTADVVALHTDTQHVEELLRVLHQSKRPSEHAWAAIMACNTFAISGAFFIGLTGLHVVALTNLGILAASALYERQFRCASRMLTSPVHREMHFSSQKSETERGQTIAPKVERISLRLQSPEMQIQNGFDTSAQHGTMARTLV